MAQWQNTENASPLFALMREMVDDVAPHLNGCSDDHPDIVALRARCMEEFKAGRRSAGATQAAVTRKTNEAAREKSTQGGLYPRLVGGTARQTKWATEIRGEKIGHSLGWGLGLNKGLAALIEQRTTAKFWIDTRNMPWERMVEKYLKA
jgi:hypothetical protein